MKVDVQYPEQHGQFLDRCHTAGQTRPTPLLLQYGAGDYNCLHQDLYGAHVFPLQVAILLSDPGEDFTGGEFVLTEQRPACSRGPRWCLCVRGMPLSSPRTTARWQAPAATTGSTCATG